MSYMMALAMFDLHQTLRPASNEKLSDLECVGLEHVCLKQGCHVC